MPLFRAAGGALLLSWLCVSCGGPRASLVPLGGKHDVEVAAAPAKASELPRADASSITPEDEAEADRAEVSEIVSTKATPASEPLAPTAPAAFQVRPYAAGQRWTRSFDLEMNVKVGPDYSMEMRMVSHQEAKFEVLAATAGNVDKLQIEYAVYTSKLSLVGAPPQDSPEALSGKRYVITFASGKPEVRDASGGTPPKKELDTIKDDAREPAEIAKALTELAQLTAKGKGDFSTPGAIALAGGEDEDTKVTRAKASLRSLGAAKSGAKSAIIDLSYTLTSALEDDGSLEAQVSGNLTAFDGPARYDTVTLQGPVELKPKDPGGMQGRGSLKVTTTYRY